jgi:hypothetical protein
LRNNNRVIQITHVQFLTLLYPSRLEARLIMFILGPLAIVSATMQLLPIFHLSNKVASLSSAVRNVCNATLSLLFAASLFIWGFLVNRRQAWRTDGGTAAFGAAALALALVSTALNFLYVPREEEYVWLPGLLWAVVLWQSFLGWWWWVGAGSRGLDKETMEEIERSEEEKERRRQKRREARERAREAWKGVAGAFNGTSRRRATQERESESFTTPDDDDSMTASSVTSQSTRLTLPAFFPAFLHLWYNHIRQAHVTAARAQAVERSEVLREGHSKVGGWGLGNFYWGKKEPSRRQVHQQADGNGAKALNDDGRQAGMWWWGPLRRWRLRDTAMYSD